MSGNETSVGQDSGSFSACIELIISRLVFARDGQNVLLNTVLALRDFIWALERSGRRSASIDLVARLDNAIADVAPVVVCEVGQSHPAPDIQMGRQAAIDFLRLFETPCDDANFPRVLSLAQDRIDHIALLADEFDALFRRRLIDARGNPFRVSITGNQFIHQSASGATLH